MNLKNSYWIKTCYRYGSDSPLDNIKTVDIGTTYFNLEIKKQINLAFYSTKEHCETACKASNKYYSCLPSNSSYDKAFGIRANTFVCWLKDTCMKRTHEYEEFKNKDASIHYSSKNKCNYLCNSVYMNRGHCMINKDFNYYCYYKTVADEKKSLANKAERLKNGGRIKELLPRYIVK